MTAASPTSLDLLARLVGFNTVSDRSNLDLIRFVAEYLRSHDIPFVEAPNAAGDKAALYATIGPMVDGGVVLSGHTDVVPVAGQPWTGDPFTLRRDGTRLVGARRLRHEGLRRGLPGDGTGAQAHAAEAPRPHLALL